FLTFEGEWKGGEPPEHGGAEEPQAGHASMPHESPLVMALPLLILAVPATLIGFTNFPSHSTEGIAHLLEGALPLSSAEALDHESFNWAVAISSTGLALGGIALAWAIYQAKLVPAASLQKVWGPLHTLVARKYYMDDLYEGLIVREGLYNFATGVGQWFDTHVVD